MATKSSEESKTKSAPKKAAPKADAAPKTEPAKTEPTKAARKKVGPNTSADNGGPNPTVKKEIPKKAAPKKAAGPKLTPPQLSLLELISKVTEPQGYVAEKKPEQKTVDTLLKHKLVKKGKKDEKTKNYYVLISQFGKKFLGNIQAPASKV